ncbi:hypothetical protein ACFQZ4_37460 [Catellatospora coxensis]
MPDETTAAGGEDRAGRPQHTDHQRRRRLRRWWLFSATALAVLLCIQPLFTGGDDAGSPPSAWHPDTASDGSWSIGPAQPTVESARPTATLRPRRAQPARHDPRPRLLPALAVT